MELGVLLLLNLCLLATTRKTFYFFKSITSKLPGLSLLKICIFKIMPDLCIMLYTFTINRTIFTLKARYTIMQLTKTPEEVISTALEKCSKLFLVVYFRAQCLYIVPSVTHNSESDAAFLKIFRHQNIISNMVVRLFNSRKNNSFNLCSIQPARLLEIWHDTPHQTFHLIKSRLHQEGK